MELLYRKPQRLSLLGALCAETTKNNRKLQFMPLCAASRTMALN